MKTRAEMGTETVREFAYQTLEHLCKFVPYSSINLAWDMEDCPEKNIYAASKKWANWYKNSLASKERWLEERKKKDDNRQSIPYGIFSDAKEDEAYSHMRDAYHAVVNSKTGVCIYLAFAAAYVLIEHLQYPGIVRVFLGMGEDDDEHAFLVLNCPDTVAVLNIEELPEGSFIVDPWIRCCFRPDQAKTFWNYAMDLIECADRFCCKQVMAVNGEHYGSGLIEEVDDLVEPNASALSVMGSNQDPPASLEQKCSVYSSGQTFLNGSVEASAVTQSTPVVFENQLQNMASHIPSIGSCTK